MVSILRACVSIYIRVVYIYMLPRHEYFDYWLDFLYPQELYLPLQSCYWHYHPNLNSFDHVALHYRPPFLKNIVQLSNYCKGVLESLYFSIYCIVLIIICYMTIISEILIFYFLTGNILFKIQNGRRITKGTCWKSVFLHLLHSSHYFWHFDMLHDHIY